LQFAKCYDAVRLTNEFPAKGWKKSTLNDFIKRLKQTESITSEAGSGRPRTQTHSTVRQIARETRFHPPGSTPVREQRRCWRSFALFFSCRYQTFLLLIRSSFYGKVSSVKGQLPVSYIIDTVWFSEELWDIIDVSGFF